MKNATKAILGAAVITLVLPFLSFAAEETDILSFAAEEADKSIYGKDNRIDFFSASAGMRALAGSVVSLWDTEKAILDPASKTYTLKTENFGDKLNLCPGEKFREQTIGAFCSGSLVGADMVMTAGHCITDAAGCADTKLVFGYAVKKAGAQAPVKIAQGEVYSCIRIIKRFQGDEPGAGPTSGLGPDYALIQLDRKVKRHKALAVNRNRILNKGDGVFVIGYPVGLPLKVTGGATVRDTTPDGYFVADLDTFGGNSGSPVFNAKTRLVEGILVRGDADFEQSPATGCTTMATYAQDGGRGEDVTKISELQAFIPKLPIEKRAEAVVAANSIKTVSIGDIAALQGLDTGALSGF